jgi:hypothetical protein
MRREDLPNELLELLHQSGIDVDTLPAELTDQELEAVVGGKQRMANRMATVMAPVVYEASGLGLLSRLLGGK